MLESPPLNYRENGIIINQVFCCVKKKKIIEPAVKVKTVTVGDGAKYYLSTLE